MDKLEFYNDVNWMKAGIVYSDKINTVSQKYAEEIQTKEYGEKLDDLLKELSYKLSGILNGVDYTDCDPETDKLIPKRFSASKPEGKKDCKKALLRELKLDTNPNIPLIGLVSRFTGQKGLDLIEAISHDLRELKAQFVFLGSGEEKFEIAFKDLDFTTKNIRTVIGFNPKLAQKIYAGADMFLMPSKFEPCGLGQLISLKYGTVPIVRETGGLADTIQDFSLQNLQGNGFTFKDYDAEMLLETIKRAIEMYKNKDNWKKLTLNAMNCDFSWNKSAQQYINLYEKIVEDHKISYGN